VHVQNVLYRSKELTFLLPHHDGPDALLRLRHSSFGRPSAQPLQLALGAGTRRIAAAAAAGRAGAAVRDFYNRERSSGKDCIEMEKCDEAKSESVKGRSASFGPSFITRRGREKNLPLASSGWRAGQTVALIS